MHTYLLATVLALHSVTTTETHQPAVPEVSHPSYQVAHGWPIFYPWVPPPRIYTGCVNCEPPSRYEMAERPWRPVSLSLALGFGLASGAELPTSDSGLSFSARLGAGLVDRLSLIVGFEGMSSRRYEHDELAGALLLGLQWYPVPFLYFRGAVGAGAIKMSEPGSSGSGFAGGESNVIHPALSGGIGIEFGASSDFSFALEASSTWMYLPTDSWSSVSLNLVVNFF
jgi:hypothetical protein